MASEYSIIQFDGIPDNGYVDIKELEKFIENAEMIFSSYGLAWSKSFINKVGDSLRGATLEFKDGTMTQGYNVKSKLVWKESDLVKPEKIQPIGEWLDLKVQHFYKDAMFTFTRSVLKVTGLDSENDKL